MSLARRDFIAGAGALAGAALPSLARAQALPLRIATMPIDAAAQAYYAADLGLFKRAGLDATLQTVSSGPQMIPIVMSGTLDVGFANLIPIAQAYLKGFPLVIIAPAALYSRTSPTTALMVAVDSPIRSAKDLNGKAIGTVALGGNITQLGPQLWMDRNGGDSRTIRWLEVPQSELPIALTTGRVDAIVGIEPALTEAKHRGARVLANALDTVGDTYVLGAWFSTKAWAAEHRDTVLKTANALNEAGRWANAHQKESAAILIARTKLDADTTNGMTRAVYAAGLDSKLLQPEIDVAAKYGTLARAFPVTDMLYP